MPDRPLSPQEKKALSYARDRRDGYGENAKASRRIVPLRKAKQNRGHRKAVAQALVVGARAEAADLEALDASVGAIPRATFDQVPAIPLAEAVDRKRRKRAGTAGRKARPRP